jgi:hypothetical protein
MGLREASRPSTLKPGSPDFADSSARLRQVEAAMSGYYSPYSPINFLSISSSVGDVVGLPSHAGNYLTTDFDGQFPDPIYPAGSYSFTFTGSLDSTQTAAAPFGVDVRLTAVSAPEIDPSSWFSGLALLLGSAAVIRGRRARSA